MCYNTVCGNSAVTRPAFCAGDMGRTLSLFAYPTVALGAVTRVASWKAGKELEKMEKRYFMVSCERGHLGRGKSAIIKFAIEADNMIKAMDIAKKMPAVKHTKTILSAREIEKEEYNEYRMISAYNR